MYNTGYLNGRDGVYIIQNPGIEFEIKMLSRTDHSLSQFRFK